MKTCISKPRDLVSFLLNAWMNRNLNLKLSIKFKPLSNAIRYTVTLSLFPLLKENRHSTSPLPFFLEDKHRLPS